MLRHGGAIGEAVGVGHSPAPSPAPRADRRPARWRAASLAWWTDAEELIGVAATLWEIGPEGALIDAHDLPPTGRPVRFEVEGFEPARSVIATVERRGRAPDGRRRALLHFAEACPPALLSAALGRGPDRD